MLDMVEECDNILGSFTLLEQGLGVHGMKEHGALVKEGNLEVKTAVREQSVGAYIQRRRRTHRQGD